MTIPCKDCITFPICNSQIQAGMNNNQDVEVQTITRICDKCSILSQWLFSPINKDRGREFLSIYKISCIEEKGNIVYDNPL